MDGNTYRVTRRVIGDVDTRDAAAPSPKRTKTTSNGLHATPRLSHRDYTIGWISAIFVEFAAAQALFDEIHEDLTPEPSDNNRYKLGRMGHFNVAIACLGEMGMNSAATAANNMVRTFTGIKLQLIVGVAGGVPTLQNDVRLGDVVVGSKVIQHDFGKTIRDSHFQNTAPDYAPPNRVKAALTAFRAEHDVNGSHVSQILDDMLRRKPNMARYAGCAMLDDTLYDNNYIHPDENDGCELCDVSKRTERPERSDRMPRIHFGTIASGNQVVKDAQTRDHFGKHYGALCIEMEGAALRGNDTPFLVIRGICDYADSHKNKQWQPYAAATAAACAKELMTFLLPDSNDVDQDIITLQQEESLHTDLGLLEAKRLVLMDSLGFDQISAREANIKPAHTKTCKWVLRKDEFLDWLNMAKLSEHHGLLWIKGNPGSGKSTIMKFALSHLRRKHKSHIFASFFFNARGDQMEKSVEGMYRTLLVQILTQVPQLQHILDSIGPGGAEIQWTNATLQDLLRQAVQSLEQQPLLCFVDALDECNPNEVRDMVYFFEDLGVLSTEAKLEFHVCFASRHYPHITVRKAVEMILDGQEGHEQDIRNYINDKLNIGMGKTVQRIQTRLQEKAASIFMWVVLVVKMLNEQADTGVHPTSLEKELNRIPRDLDALFRDILTRDQKDRDKLLLCIQWVLFARRPLTPSEMYLAIHSGLGDHEVISTPWDEEEMTVGRVRLFILASSKGLVEITTTKKPTAQFIHESVNDFFHKGSGLHDIWPDLDGRFEGLGHDALKSCCFEYIRIKDSVSELLLPHGISGRMFKADRVANRRSILSHFPFLAYAIDNILWHAERAHIYCFEQGQFVQDFTAQVQLFREIHNALQTNQYRHYSSDVSLLYLLAERDLGGLISLSSAKLACLNTETSRFGMPLIAAIATESFAAVHVFVKALRKYLGDKDDQGITLQQIAMKGPRSRFGTLYGFHLQRTMFFDLVRHGNVPIFDAVSRCLKADVKMREYTHPSRTLLHYAEDGDMVAYLVERGADVNVLDDSGESPLARALNDDVALGLIQNGATIGIVGSKQETLLHIVAGRGFEQSTRLLLQKGTLLDAKDFRGRTALLRAAEGRSLSILALLIDFGADVSAWDDEGNTAVHLLASNWLSEEHFELLHSKGAPADSKDFYGRTPLSLLVRRATSGSQVIEMLLKAIVRRGAKLDSIDSSGRTPLDYAAENTSFPGLADILRRMAAEVGDTSGLFVERGGNKGREQKPE